MSKRTFTLPCTLDSAARRKDRSIGLRFTSNTEVVTADFAELDGFYGESGWLLFSSDELTEADIPKEEAPGPERTLEQQLNGVLYKIWKQAGEVEPYNQYRRRQLEKVIRKYRESLNDSY